MCVEVWVCVVDQTTTRHTGWGHSVHPDRYGPPGHQMISTTIECITRMFRAFMVPGGWILMTLVIPWPFFWSHRLVESFAFLKNVCGWTFFFHKNRNDFSLTFFFFFFIYRHYQVIILDQRQYDLWHHFLFELVFCLVLTSKFKHALLKEDGQPDTRYVKNSKGKKHLEASCDTFRSKEISHKRRNKVENETGNTN